MTFRDITIKVLTITGFLVTVAVIAWGTKEAIVRIPGAFSSLASIAESINTYRPVKEPVAVVVENVPAETAVVETPPVEPEPVVPTPIETGVVEVPTLEEPNEPEVVVPVAVPVVQEKTPTAIALVNDLQMTILGSGVLEDDTFEYTSSYKENLNNALRFDVKNVGTKTSGTWYFNVVLPSGKVYTSPMQASLNPHDHIEFTLGFYLNEEDMQRATLTTMLYSNTDVNASNNTKSITVNVQ